MGTMLFNTIYVRGPALVQDCLQLKRKPCSQAPILCILVSWWSASVLGIYPYGCINMRFLSRKAQLFISVQRLL